MTHEAETPPSPSATQADKVVWHPSKRLGFRIATVYFLLYTLPFPLDYLPWLGTYVSRFVGWLWEWAARSTARVLGIEDLLSFGPTGSGDTAFDYVKLLLAVVLAVAVATAWSVLDRKTLHYEPARRWLVVGCRYYLGTVMLTYGILKVIPTQFPLPSLTRLLTLYGDSSPMGLVWTFMGASPAYTVFAGLGEAVGGLLLFFERTRALGAAVLVAVMSNVVMINYAYDVPVKLFSSHLLVMALGLLMIDGRRLLTAFLGRAAPGTRPVPLFRARWANVTGKTLGLLLVASVIYGNTSRALGLYRSFGNGRVKPPLWGIHDVESFTLDGRVLPPLVTDEVRWRALVIDRILPMEQGGFSQPGSVSVWHMDGTFSHHSVELDETAATLTVLPQGEMGRAAARAEAVPEPEVLRYERPAPDRLVVRGRFQGSEVEVHMRERDLGSMELVGRGYHWVNEYPHNR